MGRIFNISTIYFILIILLNLQGVVYEGGNSLSKGIVGLFVLYSVFYTIYTNIHFKLPPYFKWLNILLIVFTLYGLIHIFSTPVDYILVGDKETPSYTYILYIFISLLPIYVFYLATIKGEFSTSKIQWWTIIILILSIIKFVTYYLNNSNIVGVDEITNNNGYLFVGIIPLLLFFDKKPILQYVLLAICMIFVMLSMKRGAILVASFCLIPFVLWQWRHSTQKKRVALSAIIIIFIIGAILFISHLLHTSDFFSQRIEATREGNSSMRDELYMQLWSYLINDASSINILFGGGANYTLHVADNFAHNDWLEILINQGILGAILYIMYWINFWKSQKLCVNIPELNIAHSGLIICFLASFIMTLFSMSYGSLPIGLTMAIGICFGQITRYHSGLEIS